MQPQELTRDEVYQAARDVTDRWHQIASSPARVEGRKRLAYNPFTCTYQVTTGKTEATFKDPETAAAHYSAK